LLLGQFATDVLSKESSMHLRVGETKNYSESDRSCELVVVDTTSPDSDQVVAVPSRMLQTGREIWLPELPFTLKVKQYFPNSSLATERADGLEEVVVSNSLRMPVFWRSQPHETTMQRRDMPSGIIELATPKESLGTWLVSSFLNRAQEFSYGGKTYEIALRFERLYFPYALQLLEFRHDKYPGTDIPKNFSSRVRLQRGDSGENREVLIYMNNPLRYAGETYYQASFDPDDKGSVLQVVRNPGWLTPYLACVLVAAGLITQFLMHLIPFLKRRTAV
jgi:hypothetical protein